MASIRLADYEVEPEGLPQVCICCGQPADGDTRVNFAWYPGWVNILILAGLLPWALVAMILTKRMRTHLPTCQRHRGHWFNRKLFVWGGVLFFMAIGVACIVILATANQQRGLDDLAGYICAAGVIGGLIWLIAALIYNSSGVRPTEITDRDIVLTKVSPDFIDAVCDYRHENDEEEILKPNWWQRRRRRRRRDDDEDDEE
jgi:hypothetical protein